MEKNLLLSLLDDVQRMEYNDGKLNKILKRGEMIINKIFGSNSGYKKSMKNLNFHPMVLYPSKIQKEDYEKSFNDDKKKLIDLIEVMIEDISISTQKELSGKPITLEKVAKLQKQYESARNGKDTKNQPSTIEAYHRWYNAANILFSQHFNDKNPHYIKFKGANNEGNGYSLSSEYNAIQGDVAVLMDQIECRISKNGNNKEYSTSNVFIVHGHDDAMKQEVARFIEQLSLNPIILNEQVNKGKTIIEKLESNADVGFAVILLSPCDLGKSKKDTELNPRARQNVIVEMGYFVGKLGRDKVCILRKDTVEEPSDFTGVVYTPFDDNGGWKINLARELTSSGYKIDMNNIIHTE